MGSYIYPFINFFLFVFLLFWFGRKPLTAMAASKKEDFERAFNEARKSQQEAEGRLQKAQNQMADLEKEIALLKQRGQEDLDREIEKMKEQGRRQTEHVRLEAERFVKTELEAQKRLLKKELWTQTQSLVEKELATPAAQDKSKVYMDRQIVQLANLKVGGGS